MNTAKAVHPLYYGAYSSHGPTHDSTFANLTKAETELVYSTYGDDVGVSYAESIKNFSRNCEYATFIVDHLLDILTGEQKLLREEETEISDALQADTVDFTSLRSLENEGIDMSFLDDLQTRYNAGVRLDQTAGLLESLRSVQYERLGSVAATSLAETRGPGERERELAGQIQGNLADMVAGVRPRDVGMPAANLGHVKRVLGAGADSA